MIKASFDNEILTLYVEGSRIDTTNAPAVETEVNDIFEQYPNAAAVVMDVEKLEYISSVGLRLVLKIKKSHPDTKVINASTEVYEIFEMTGFAEMMTVEKAFKQWNIDGCEVIGEGAKGIVYRYNSDTIVKVYKNNDCFGDIQRERDLARKAFVLGIPTAISFDIVKVGDHFASVFELLDAKSVSKLVYEDPTTCEKYAKIYADLLRQIHQTKVKKDDMPNVKRTPRKWINNCKNYLSEATWNKINNMIESAAEQETMIHGDYHSNNIMIQNGEVVLIDMDTLAYGHPVFELANVYVTYVAFGEVVPQHVTDFILISYEDALKFWDFFIPEYLQTNDKAKIEDVTKKAALLAHLRIVSRTPRMDCWDEDLKAKLISHSVEQIEALAPQIDTLEFDL